MKTCPYCGEEIQDDAVVCNDCGHDVAVGERPQESTASLEVTSLNRRVAALLALAIGAAAVLVFVQTKHRSYGTVSQSGRPKAGRLRAPHIVLIASRSETDIEPGTTERFDWTVPAEQPNCHLTGHIEVTSSDKKAVQVLVTTADGYKRLANGQSATAYLRSETAMVNLDIWLNAPGHMVLAIGNAAAAVAEKRVQLSDVKATCT